jgi:hypothetical protein
MMEKVRRTHAEPPFGAGVALSRGPAAEAQNGLVCALLEA